MFATLVFDKDASVQPDALAPAIAMRISNRKPYHKTLLTEHERASLIAAGIQDGKCAFVLDENREDIQHIGRIGATNEEVMLANKGLHQFFFNHVSWTKEEDARKKVGFYIKTLELPPPAQVMFRVFKHWSIMSVLVKLGFNKIAAGQNAVTNASASAIGAVIIPHTEPLDFVHAGRAVERVWLAATAQGLVCQPLVGILFFELKIRAGEHDVFTPAQQKLIANAYRHAADILKVGDRYLAFMLRIGRGDAPSAHAVRFPLEEVVEVRA